MAVSAVMNKTTSTRVSERKRAVIEQIAREMGYRSNVVARTLRGGESRMIGILIDSCAPPWLYNILRHIESEATAGGYRILISEGHDSVDNLAAAYETASALGTVGLTTGITPNLSTFSHLLLVAMMYLGRVGVLSLSVAFLSQGGRQSRISYPESDVMIG